MRMLSTYKVKIRSYIRMLTFKERIYYTLLCIGLLSSMLGFASAVIAGLDLTGLCASGACGLYLMFVFAYSLLTKNMNRASLLICVGYNFILFPINYIYSGGATGGMPLYFIMGIFTINLLITGSMRILLSVLSVVSYSVLILYGHYHPESITLFHDSFSATVDLILSMLIVSFLIGTGVSALMREYGAEHQKVALLNQQLQEFAIKDPLTNLYNRRYLRKQLEYLIKQSKKDHQKLAVIIFDIDFFKKINDTYGHLVGDEVLKGFSRVLMEETRAHDIVGRYGGEEFLLILSETDAEAAMRLAERICQVVAKLPLANQLAVPITVSGGIGCFVEDMTIEEIIAEADNNLYKAKFAGRNQVISA